MPLDCDGFAAALADYLEGDAPDAVRAAVEAHAADVRGLPRSCSRISRAIRTHAAALPALAPSRDLWSGIAERIDARVLPLRAPATRTILPARRTWARPAVAAAALVVVTAGITHFATRASMPARRRSTTAAHRQDASAHDRPSTQTPRAAGRRSSRPPRAATARRGRHRRRRAAGRAARRSHADRGRRRSPHRPRGAERHSARERRAA